MFKLNYDEVNKLLDRFDEFDAKFLSHYSAQDLMALSDLSDEDFHDRVNWWFELFYKKTKTPVFLLFILVVWLREYKLNLIPSLFDRFDDLAEMGYIYTNKGSPFVLSTAELARFTTWYNT